MGVGRVYLVGAGPGAPDLITLRGYRALCRADLIISDCLLPRTFLDALGIAAGGKRVEWLGDDPNRKRQSEINALMACAAKEGKAVARLKCGDPFVFGRGEEETTFLSRRGVPWEVIPGPSASTAACASAGLPLTRRGCGRSFAVVTARQAGGGVHHDYPRADTLVILMGVAVLDEVASELIRGGWPVETPAALVERATLPWERRASGPLAEIAGIAREAFIKAPAVLVVGQAASQTDVSVARPRILFTGLDPSNFRTLGDVLHWPALHVVREERSWQSLPNVLFRLERQEYEYVIFTSRPAVRCFFEALEAYELDARVVHSAQIVACGAGTALDLRDRGLRADIVPQEPGSQGILNALSASDHERVLLLQGGQAPTALHSALTRRRLNVTRLTPYRAVPNRELARPLPEHDVIYFTSPSGVRAYWDAFGEEAFRSQVWCVGDITLGQVKALGFDGKVVRPHVSEHENATVPAL